MPVVPHLKGYRVLVQPLEAAEATSTGIVLPDEARKRQSRGVVIAVGQGYDSLSGREPPTEVGDVVVWDDCPGLSKYPGPPPRVWLDLGENGKQEEFVVLEWGDVMMVLEESPSVVCGDSSSAP